MKKVFLCAMLVVFMVSAASADVGILSKLNVTPEEFQGAVRSAKDAGRVKIFSAGGSEGELSFVFYDSINALQLALNKGDVDQIALPEVVAEYLMNVTGGYEVSSVVKKDPVYLSFGFRKSDDPELKDKFNDALLSMKTDGTLAIIVSKFVYEPGIGDPEPVNFFKYANADTIKVAITGDVPPIDYVGADGKPAGFNTAILAEISRRLHINVELINIDAGARAASLASGRADVVFWFQGEKGEGIQADVPDGVALSESYYSWNEILLLKKK